MEGKFSFEHTIARSPADKPGGNETPKKRPTRRPPQLGGKREHLSEGDEQRGAKSLRGAIFGTDVNGKLSEDRISWPEDWARLNRRKPPGFKDVDLSKRFERKTVTRMLQKGGEKVFANVLESYGPTILEDLRTFVPRLRKVIDRFKDPETQKSIDQNFLATLPIADKVLDAMEQILQPLKGTLNDIEKSQKNPSAQGSLQHLFDATTGKPSKELRSVIELWLWAKFNHIIPVFNEDRRGSEQNPKISSKSESAEALWENASRHFVLAIVNLTHWERQRRAVIERNKAASDTQNVAMDRVSKVTGEKVLVNARDLPRSWLSDILIHAPQGQKAIGYLGGAAVQQTLENVLKIHVAPSSEKKEKKAAAQALDTARKPKKEAGPLQSPAAAPLQDYEVGLMKKDLEFLARVREALAGLSTDTDVPPEERERFARSVEDIDRALTSNNFRKIRNTALRWLDRGLE